ncbi:ATP-binding protein [Microbacterium sp. NPDC089189]|uniref:sensor histidine kinase n=1 Tax=Microbacterium sp. NPDC089189 TaxID=3154972 RepID=UPI0034263624
MPLFEQGATRRGRIRVFLRAQLPFALGVLFIAMIAAIVHPEGLSTPAMLIGFGIAAVATLAAIVVPWERYRPSWMILVAVADLLAVALVRAELFPFVPAVTMLAVFPILWLAYGFAWPGMVVAVFGAGFITSFQFAYVGAWPDTPVEWANVVTLPTLIVGVAVIVFVAARQLRRNARRLTEASAAQSAALREAKDTEAVALGILNTVNAGVAFYDNEGRLDVANKLAHAMTQMVGFELDEPPYAGDNVLAADRVSVIPYDQQIIPRALRGEIIQDHVEWLGPPDEQVAIMASSSRVYRDDGQLLGTVIVAYDVTELADAVEVREQFLRTVSHELRTPTTSITGFLDLIADELDPADEKLQRYVEIVTRKTNDLFTRVGELLQAHGGEKTLHLVDLDVEGVIRTATERTRDAAAANGMAVEVAGASPLHARADADQLVIAVTELITNAVKFGTPGSPVTVRYQESEGRVRIAVSNSGPGVSHAEQRRVFDRFYRTPSARSREIQGFGLGLTNLRAIVDAHDGHVLIDSAPGTPTTFTIDLPVGGPAATPPEEGSAELRAPR